MVRAQHENPLNPDEGAGLYILQLVNMPGYDSWALKYAHLRAIFVRPAQRVQRGEVIAESGHSGATEGVYLHVDLMNLTHQWRPIALEG